MLKFLKELSLFKPKVIYSQEGEDILLKELMNGEKIGFYVDIGAHHPFRFSNTCIFYKKGWKGINIDPLPGTMKKFKRQRPRDINLELGVGESSKEMIYYMFNEPALNTFSRKVAKQRERESKWRIINEKKVKIYTLSEILDRYLPKDTKIDFMNIDAEGLDLSILKSNNWKKYSPEFVLVECLGEDYESLMKDESYLYMKKKGYKLVAKTMRTCIFKKLKP